MKQVKESGLQAFMKFYGEMYGERWESLFEALKTENSPKEYSKGLLKPYFMDEASIWAAEQLTLPPESKILDMCAAPGGKSLVIATNMDKSSFLSANERSRDRFFRLKHVLDEHLPKETLFQINLLNQDGSTLCKKQSEVYDRILLDAPCSSERHLIFMPKAMEDWTATRTKTNSFTQWSLLSCAFLLLKPEGELIYSTCSISKKENEDVLARLFKKYGALVKELDVSDFEGAEKKQYGTLILSDKAKGKGPMYVCKIQKQRS